MWLQNWNWLHFKDKKGLEKQNSKIEHCRIKISEWWLKKAIVLPKTFVISFYSVAIKKVLRLVLRKQQILKIV